MDNSFLLAIHIQTIQLLSDYIQSHIDALQEIIKEITEDVEPTELW